MRAGGEEMEIVRPRLGQELGADGKQSNHARARRGGRAREVRRGHAMRAWAIGTRQSALVSTI